MLQIHLWLKVSKRTASSTVSKEDLCMYVSRSSQSLLKIFIIVSVEICNSECLILCIYIYIFTVSKFRFIYIRPGIPKQM